MQSGKVMTTQLLPINLWVRHTYIAVFVGDTCLQVAHGHAFFHPPTYDHRKQESKTASASSLLPPVLALPEDRCTATAGATPLQYYHIINIFGVSEQAMSDVKSLFRKKTKQAVRMYPVLGGRGVPGRGVYSERARPAHPRLSPCIWPMRFSRPLSSPLPPSHPPYVYRSRPRLSPLSCKYISFSPLAPLSRLSFSNFVCSPLLPLFPPIHIDLFH